MTIKELELECQQARSDERQANKELQEMPMSELDSPAGRKVVERIDAAKKRFKDATVRIGKLILHD
jgi:hypothetical protein